MPTTGFHSDWITLGKHRILLECRASFPDEKMRFIANVVAVTCDNNSQSHRARVVHINYDDKACIYTITIASTDAKDSKLEKVVADALATIFHNGNCQAQVVIVKKGDEDSDHYDHMEHLSVGAGIAVDRWKHDDKKYQSKVSPPT